MSEIELKQHKMILEKLCQDHYNREIMRFFARHPYAHFDKQVLMGGLGLSDTKRIETALGVLSKEKLLETKNEFGAPLFWLTKNEPEHSVIKSSLGPKIYKTENTRDRLLMMQLIMPLSPCPATTSSIK
jgi:hypothetical protein